MAFEIKNELIALVMKGRLEIAPRRNGARIMLKLFKSEINISYIIQLVIY